jgi:4-hydroxy-3-methylbut-2-en-1-yl diphosphate synthase IspG/GcpE
MPIVPGDLPGIREHQKLEEEVWVHYSVLTTPQARNRSDKPAEVTCPSCLRGLQKDSKRA